jgi:hypothetical protein
MRASAIVAELLGLALVAAGCVGDIEGGASTESPSPETPPAMPLPCGLEKPCDGTSPPVDPLDLVVPVGARRLTLAEYANNVESLLGERPLALELDWIPRTAPSPFDNDVEDLKPDQQIIEAFDELAERATMRLLGSPERRARLLPCQPAGPGDAVCLGRFVEAFGRRAFRRPLDEAERALFVGSAAEGPLAIAIKGNDFFAGVEIVVRAMLQDPAFIYRIEVGSPVAGRPGILALSSHEIATRLAYLLWQRPPEAHEPLLKGADVPGVLQDPSQRREIAAGMLRDPRALESMRRFHALWLAPAVPEMTDANLQVRNAKLSAAVAETNAIVERVIKDRRPWMDLFQIDRTFVNKALADHYGLGWPSSAPATAPTWVLYGATGRKGILSHATMLAAGFQMDEHGSSIRRGLNLLRRLGCHDLSLPGPAELAELAKLKSEPSPPDSACKIEHSRHRLDHPGCAGCHKQFEALGVGLEGYDGSGKPRSSYEWAWTDKTAVAGATCTKGVDDYVCRKTCPVSTDGAGFRGPAELSSHLLTWTDANSPSMLERCSATQLFRFASGRREDAATDGALLGVLGTRLRNSSSSFADLLLDYVAAESFRHTRRFE